MSVQTLKTGQEGARGARERLGLELWMGSDGKAAANLLLTSFPAIQNWVCNMWRGENALGEPEGNIVIALKNH